MKIKIKVCGIRTLEEALGAIEAGVDIVGFNFYPGSPRYIIPGECMRLMVRLDAILREKMAQVTTPILSMRSSATVTWIWSSFQGMSRPR